MFPRLTHYFRSNIASFHYTIRILIGSSFLWLLLHNERTTNSLWAIISLIVVTEPQVHPAWIAVRNIVVNTVIGCTVALSSLLIFGIQIWLLPLALSVSALASALINNMKQGWKNAATITVIIMSAAMTQKSAVAAMDIAFHRTMEVILGGLTALVVTRIVAAIWLPPEVKESTAKAKTP